MGRQRWMDMDQQRWIALGMGGRIFGIRRHRITQNLELEVAWMGRWVEYFLVDFISVCQQLPKLTGEFLKKGLKRDLSGISAASQRHPKKGLEAESQEGSQSRISSWISGVSRGSQQGSRRGSQERGLSRISRGSTTSILASHHRWLGLLGEGTIKEGRKQGWKKGRPLAHI